jgi:hypothetical protein
MSLWIERILSEFPADLSRLWIVADPDGVLLDEQILFLLRERGFEVLPFEDSVAFRAEYEARYREAWDCNEQGPARALILHLRSAETSELPWDYLRQARIVSLSLANLFPKLNVGVVRQIGAEHFEALFDAQAKHATQLLGETPTKEFVLTHIYRIGPHIISRSEDLWRELLRLHYRNDDMPVVLANHVAKILREQDAFKNLPVAELFASKSTMLRTVQDAWYRYLDDLGVKGSRVSEPAPADYIEKIRVPFDHPDVRTLVDSMFLDGMLHPLAIDGVLTGIPEWAKVGVIQDPAALRHLVLNGVIRLLDHLPTIDSSYRDWSQMAKSFGEILARYHSLNSAHANEIGSNVSDLQEQADGRMHTWVEKRYATMSSLPVTNGPVMVHHVPRFLSLRRHAGETKVALLVFDGLAVDQWIQIRERIAKHSPNIGFEESTCFAWLPTLTSVSRQALFSGLKPYEFADTIETTAQEPAQWNRFWKDNGLNANEIFYRKGIKRLDQLDDLESELANPSIKAAGIVVDTVDEIVHGAILGKRGIANQIDSWCESGFADRLFGNLLSNGYHIYLTADHGNVEAIGQGRPSKDAPEQKGERVRIYRSDALIGDNTESSYNTYKLNVAGLPANYQPVFAAERTAFVPAGEHVVVHGGISVEELIVPFIKIFQLPDAV